MASAPAARSLQAIKPHLPLIKFRKGGPAIKADHTSQSSSSPSNSAHSSKESRSIIDDSQLPPKYARKPLSDIEIQFIMRGGPE